MRTFIQRRSVTFEAAPDNVKADDSGLMRVYAELLRCPPSLQRRRGSTVVSEVEEGKLAKEKIIKGPGSMPGFLVG
jgi:hypothetical protein